MPERIIILRREELYAAVWEKPMHAVASSLGISGVALSKICKKLSIPVPARGHWARLSVRRRVPPQSLPKIKAGAPTQHRLVLPSKFTPTPRKEALVPRITVPEELDQPHPLVRLASKMLQGSPEAVRRRRSTCLDVEVSKESLDRALRILDALIKALEERGYAVEVTRPRQSPHGGPPRTPSTTRASVDGEWIAFRLEERQEQVRNRVDPGEPLSRLPTMLRGTGRLRLQITTVPSGSRLRQSWTDGKRQRLEECLGDFVAYLLPISAVVKANRAERERREKDWAEASRRQEELRKQAEIEERLSHDLRTRAAEWNEAQGIQAFLEAAEEEVSSRLGLDTNTLTINTAWLAWAQNRLASIRAGSMDFCKVLTPPAKNQGIQTATVPRSTISAEDIRSYLASLHKEGSR
jgi:hypothetical protein